MRTAVIERLLSRLPTGARALAWGGILVGILAFWVALPPLKVREAFVPLVIGLVAIGLGIAGSAGARL